MRSFSLSVLAALFFVVVVSATLPHSSSSSPKFTNEDGLENEKFFLPAPPVRESYECQLKALKKASLQNGMTNEWKKYEPKFKQHMDAWKKCDSLVGILNKLWCNVKEGGYIYTLDVRYNMSLLKHPNYKKFEQDYKQMVKEKMCLGSGSFSSKQ